MDKIYLYDDHIVITGYYSDIHHELMYDELYGDNSDGSSGFIYDENPGSGFVYLADGGTMRMQPPISRWLFFFGQPCRESNPVRGGTRQWRVPGGAPPGAEPSSVAEGNAAIPAGGTI